MSSASPKSRKSKKEGVKAEVVEEVEKAGKAVKREVKRAERMGAESARRPKAKPQAKAPAGKAPVPSVLSRHGTEMIKREGKGFSVGELSSAGLAPGEAARWGARVDYRRRSVIESNVSALKGWAASPAAAPKSEGEPEKAGRALERAGEEVAREAEKAGKAVKKEAKRVEKGAEQKLGKKPRAKKSES
ncbi:MAG: ribosomal protein L13e [Nitrososphaerota archaeon]|nr:ribosomal protein L13e [Nitrososphaerota archaeon]MDG6942075.1 ribosomal protein L13e [Nitrososphaerota archaeon]MDG6942540.1 ribosomal protein L13e [Nitrososphaerota archaeon]MDG6948327.1 ribosomal protein L13e [Nitrososphaerota archaeon]MDG6950253.1 ribosomal protein L13e [Nitrososphaerota archaeon]